MAHRLLVVPGDNDTLRSLQGQLGDDIDVQILNSANDALWEVRNAPPEVIIADVDLPGMSGLDLAEILPNFGVPTKVVLWSREPDALAAQQAAAHGVHQFLNGPLSDGELRQILRDMIQQTQPASVATPATVAVPVEPPAPPPAAPTPEPPRAADVGERPRRERPASPEAARPAPEQLSLLRKATRRREGALVMTEENLAPIRRCMSDLRQEVGSQCILLTDRAGMVLTEVGNSAGLPTVILLPLLSTSFSTAGQISQVLRENESSALYVQEGKHYNLYCFDVLQRFMLVLIFDNAASATKIGTVWVYAKRAIREMQEMLA
jgi:CheY-like chemotaxis protein/predicted regulator of Ras-like GTPase activity (Roadblock/LC7/MglB family)